MPNKNKIYEDPFISGRDVKGLKEKGNIDLTKRPIAKNSDGSISTVRSISVEFDGEQVLIPTVSDDGKVLSDEEAIEAYKKTGKHLGKFSSSEDATKYSKELHGTQALYYGEGVEQNANYTPKENVTGNLPIPIKLGEQMSFSPSSVWNVNSELYPKQTEILNNKELISETQAKAAAQVNTSTPANAVTSRGHGNWTSDDLSQLNAYNPNWREEAISPANYADYNTYKTAREEWLAKQNSPTGTEEGNISDDATRAIMESMGRNIEANKKDIMGNRAFNYAISLGELMHNINEAKYAGEPVKEPMMIVGDRMSAKASLDSIDRSKASAIKQLASVGRQDMIPSVLKEADNKKLEVMQNVENANAQIGNQIKQINQQTYNQGIELGMRGNQFDAQMLAQQEALRGASESQNIENIRKTATDYTNSMTMNKDNKLSYDIYAAALKDPELMKSINTFIDMMNRRTKK